MDESENVEVAELKQCLVRTTYSRPWPGSNTYDSVHPRAIRGQLNCTIPITFDIVRSVLSRYNIVWFHGDSILAQTFYTLACMLNSTIEQWNGNNTISNIVWKVGLGMDTPEQFEYRHASGTTKFIYSRFGQSWGLDANLFEYDFPLAAANLSSRDAIVTNGAAAHYHPDHGRNFSTVVDFIIEKSKITNATMYYFEPTHQEWPTSNGIYRENLGSCPCYPLTDAQLMGMETNYTCDAATRLYGNISISKVPSFWQVDVVKHLLVEKSSINIHLVPIYWQLVSRDGGSSKHDGDCTHKDVYATITMIYQLTRAIMDVLPGIGE